MDSRYDHLVAEELARKKWQQEETYAVSRTYTYPQYTIDTPPPTVSGALHIGHIFSYTQTDIIARYKRLQGQNVYYPFGFDDNGLATERFVEKKRNIRPEQMSRSEFIAICLEESRLAAQEFKELWTKIGLSIDWKYAYSTISPRSQQLSQQSFIRLYKKGYVYRTHEPALYCTTCRTSVAQADLETKEVTAKFNDIIFFDAHNKPLLVGTTRPELLPSCVALMYHPDDERYKYLKNTQCRVPLFDLIIPVIADNKVDPAKGTGLVMCCTFGDTTDIYWYKIHKLQYRQSVGFDGKWLPHRGILSGLSAHQARERIIEELRNCELLMHQREITHSVAVHERCKKEIEYVMLSQWFISILEHKGKFLALADDIKWHPEFMKTRYIDWVENLHWDWCISRQRFYGIPFPVWYCMSCKATLLAPEQMLPIDPQVTSFPGGTCTECGATDIVPETDVMDTWNTSSITPYICIDLLQGKNKSPFDYAGAEKLIPMGMRAQAHDIIRTWAFDTIVKSWMHDAVIPWNSIIISGHVLSPQKEKISKSQGNNPMDPINLLQKYPADAIRYWTASGSLGHDVMFSEIELKKGMRLLTKLWNAFRFLKPHIENPGILELTLHSRINQWLLHHLNKSIKKYHANFGEYQFGGALQAVDMFFWHYFCDNYIEIIKNQLFNPHEYPQEVARETQHMLYYVGKIILQLYAPYIPHITETLYGLIYQQHEKTPSIHITQLQFADVAYEHNAQIIDSIVYIIEQVRKLKSEHKVSLKVPISKLIVVGINPVMHQSIQAEEQLLKGIVHAQNVVFEIAAITESRVTINSDNVIDTMTIIL